MRIRIGNQTSFSAPTIVPFEYAAACGFDAFEWFPDKKGSGEGWSERDLSPETRDYIRTTALIRDIRQSVHAPWPADPLQPSADAVFERTARFAQEIAASLVNIHASMSRGIGAYADAVIPLARRLADAGIVLSIENTPDAGPEAINELFLRLHDTDRAAASNIGMCLDIGHANLHPSTRNDYLAYIDRLDPCVRIIHVHMHENYGDSDSHLTLFTGPSKNNPAGVRGVVERLKMRNFSGCIILEEWPRPESLLRDARNRLLDMISGGEVARPDAVPHPVDLAERIIEADGGLPTWKKKLEWIEKRLSEGAAADTDSLAAIAVYLRFIGTGEIRCRDDGTHFRPSVNARISRKIFARLAKISSPENVLLVRKIYPWLPSFDEIYMKAEPLTLIRDIAHRNDIPRELKEEIKHTLQNKLHRSAGPEDLATSSSLLEKITSGDARYPREFVEAFRRFHGELIDFFNAGSLKSLLEKILAQRGVSGKKTIRRFLDSPEEAQDALKILDLLTLIRTSLSEDLAAAEGAAEQRLQLTDLKLEDHSFVLLSRLINEIGALRDRRDWEKPLRCLSLAVANLRLGGLPREECLAVESELAAWGAGFDPSHRGHLLRMKATLDRCRRIAETYCARILTWFPEKAERMGGALGVSRRAVTLFSEADIRRHPVFQLSKLVTILTRTVRASAGLPPWETISKGKVSGRVVYSGSLSDLRDGPGEKIIAVVEEIRGEEEIPPPVGGIVVAHDTPLLSHLAVRARQAHTVFAVCEDPESFDALKGLAGKSCLLDASGEDVTISLSSKAEERGEEAGLHRAEVITLPRVSLALEGKKLLPVAETTLENGGAKALSAKRLDAISRAGGTDFAVPRGIVIPFGAMVEALRASSALETYAELAAGLDRLPPQDCDEALDALRGVIEGLTVDEEMHSGILRHFGTKTRLIVRSSANCEDLPGLPAAGIFASIANVRAADPGPAIKKVWSSLWGGRALRELKKAGVRPDSVSMAVLIQEMIVPEFSFIMHTSNPSGGDRDAVSIEAAVGMGETLASAATAGSPYRMLYNARTGKVTIMGFASFSDASWPAPKGQMVRKTVDYSAIPLSNDEASCAALGARLGKIGAFVENIYGYSLDIEGLVSDDTVFLVQARHQEGDGTL